MIIEIGAYGNLSALACHIGDTATEEDARTLLDNLLAAGWSGWDSKDIDEQVWIDAQYGECASATFGDE